MHQSKPYDDMVQTLCALLGTSGAHIVERVYDDAWELKKAENEMKQVLPAKSGPIAVYIYMRTDRVGHSVVLQMYKGSDHFVQVFDPREWFCFGSTFWLITHRRNVNQRQVSHLGSETGP